jgi:hypothetical protein
MNKRDFLLVFLLLQSIALLMGIFLPISANKTGSKISLAKLVFDRPSYFEEFVFYYLFTLIAVLLLIGLPLIWMKIKKT